MKNLAVPVLLSLGVPATAQVPREPVPIPGAPFAGELASAGDLSARVYIDDQQRVQLSVGDGRGLSWSRPLRVDEDQTGAVKSRACVTIVGERIVAAWADTRLDPAGDCVVESDLFINVYDAPRGRFTGEVLLAFGPGVAAPSAVNAIEVAASEASGESFVHVLAQHLSHLDVDERCFTYDPVGHVALVTSRDAGASWEAPVAVSGGSDVGRPRLVADGSSVHVAWLSERKILYQKIDVAGSFQSSPVLVGPPVPAFPLDLELAGHGDRVAVAWIDLALDFRVRAAVSSDGGATFSTSDLASSELLPWAPDIDVDPASGNVIATWVDPDLQRVQTAVATRGASFSSPVGIGPEGSLSGAPAITTGGTFGVLTWAQYEQDAATVAATTLDGGLTWLPPVSLSGTPNSWLPTAINDRYRNLIATWREGPWGVDTPVHYAGGFRPQTLTATRRPSGTSFELDLFDPTVDAIGWVLVSHRPGSFVLPDGRELGLTLDALLAASFDAARSGAFAAPLDLDGGGSTPPLPMPLPGIALHAVGVGVDPTYGLGSLTDVVTLRP